MIAGFEADDYAIDFRCRHTASRLADDTPDAFALCFSFQLFFAGPPPRYASRRRYYRPFRAMDILLHLLYFAASTPAFAAFAMLYELLPSCSSPFSLLQLIIRHCRHFMISQDVMLIHTAFDAAAHILFRCCLLYC